MDTEAKQLILSLKRKWFDMTAAGIKTEDYREITRYWCKRLLEGEDEDTISDIIKMCQNNKEEVLSQEYWRPKFKKFNVNTMTLGYPSINDESRILRFKHAGIEIRTGNPEWGAEPNELYYVIKHGARI